MRSTSAPPVTEGRATSDAVGGGARNLAAVLPSVRTVALTLLALGIALRLAQYLHNDSLWLDEAFIALNLQSRSFVHLFGLLDYNQAAPPGFLFLEKLMASVFGGTELALRVVAFVSGLASVPLFYAVARRILRPWLAVLALALFAVLDPFVRYSAEVKQYSSDVVVALGLLLVALALAKPHELSLRRTLVAAAVGAAAVWLSYPAVFLLAGFGVVLVGEALWRRDRRRIRALGLVGGAWLGSFLLLATTMLDSARHLEGSLRGEDGGSAGSAFPLRGGGGGSSRSDFFLPLPPKSIDDLHRLVSASGSFVTGSVGFPNWEKAIVVVLVLLGAGAILVGRPQKALLLVAPFPFILAASALEKYPFGLRFTLFYGPYVLLLAVAGAGWVVRRVAGREPKPARLRATIVIGLGLLALLATPLESTFRRVVHHRGIEEIKPALAALQSRWHEGDSLYVYHDSQYALRYYVACGDCNVVFRAGPAASLWKSVRFIDSPASGDYPRALRSDPPRFVVSPTSEDGAAIAAASQIDRLRGRPRVWVLFTHIASGRGAQEYRDLLGRLDRLGTRRAEIRHSGAALFLYDLR